MDIQLRSVHDELGPHKRRKSLIYPVHFYTKLKASCSGFTDVISWTKHEDIFRKDYLLIVENVLGPCILMLDSQSVQVSDSMEVFQNILSIDELGVYYCTNIDRTAQFSNGTRLDQTTPITVPTPVSECLCQNHTVVEQSTDPTLWQTASVIFSLISVFLVFGFIYSFLHLHLFLVVCPNMIMFFAFVFWGVSEAQIKAWIQKYSYVSEYAVFSVVVYSVLVTEVGKKSSRIIDIFDPVADMTFKILPTLQFILQFYTFGAAGGGFIMIIIVPVLMMMTNDSMVYRCYYDFDCAKHQ
ncbi:polymeric immunoglobulin receptor-like protein [Labeo rohita]|nr:polymeric immunoglobulin receptor-like protein [Labeo rohita]